MLRGMEMTVGGGRARKGYRTMNQINMNNG
jgi:hypothetical protein